MEKFSKVLGLDNVVAMEKSPKIADIFFTKLRHLNFNKSDEVVIFNVIMAQKLEASRKNNPDS